MGAKRRPSPKKVKDLYCVIMWSSAANPLDLQRRSEEAKPQDLQRRSEALSECSLHWLVVNIIGSPILHSTSLSTGNTLVPYKGTSSSYHLVVLKQPEEIPLIKIKRSTFNLKEFTDEYNLTVISEKVIKSPM